MGGVCEDVAPITDVAVVFNIPSVSGATAGDRNSQGESRRATVRREED